MKKWAGWLTENWEVSILTLIALSVSTYSLIVSIINPNLSFSTERKIDLVLLLLAAYVLNAAKRFNQIQTISERLMQSRRSLPRCLNLINNKIMRLEQEFHAQELTFTNRYEVMDALLKMIDASHESYQGLNFYGQGWRGWMNDFYDANIGAVGRGVNVTRYFIIRNEYIENGLIQHFISEMDLQTENGIHVFFIYESDVKLISHFRDNPIRGIGLFDNQVLVVDRSLARESDGAIELIVYWDPDDVLQKNPFPHLQAKVKLYSQYRDELIAMASSRRHAP